MHLLKSELRHPLECQQDDKKRTANDRVACFMLEASDYCMYHNAPRIGTTVTFLNPQNNNVKKLVTLAKDCLHHCDWSESASAYINKGADSIDLWATFTEYRDAIRSYY